MNTTITGVRAARRWDSRGRPTIEVEVRCAGGTGRALAPAGASTGAGEAIDLRDGGDRLGGHDVSRAVTGVDERIAPALVGVDAADQEAVDLVLDELDPSPGRAVLGGNATTATSMAAAWAAADVHREPLWRLLDPAAVTLPTPQIQILGGGAHAAGALDVQDLMVVALRATSFAQALEHTAEVHLAAGRILADRGQIKGVADEGGYWPVFDRNADALDLLTDAIEAAGFTPGVDVGIALDIAAAQLGHNGRYALRREEREMDTDGLVELLVDWIDRYPIVSVEDPLGEDDERGMATFTAAVGERVQVVGDDFLVTDPGRVHRAASVGGATTVLVKPNQAGTLSRARAAFDEARAGGLGAIVSARSGETEDVTPAHLAVGWGVEQVKVGSLVRGERTAKWNELLRIEESLGGAARFLGGAALGLASEQPHTRHDGR